MQAGISAFVVAVAGLVGMTLPVTAPDAHAACPPAPVQARRQEQMQRAWAQARYGLRDNHSELAELNYKYLTKALLNMLDRG